MKRKKNQKLYNKIENTIATYPIKYTNSVSLNQQCADLILLQCVENKKQNSTTHTHIRSFAHKRKADQKRRREFS